MWGCRKQYVRRMAKKIFFTIAIFFIFCLLVEGISRLAYPLFVNKFKKQLLEEEGPNFYRNDPVLGWVLTPNFEGKRLVHGVECYYRTNSLGLRDEEYPFQKTPATFRILCLGDSITEGMRVDNAGAYPKLVEKKFAQEGKGSKVEVLNAGVVDYGIEQEYLFLKEKGIKYNPDMVIMGYFLNDGRGFVPAKTIYMKEFAGLINKSKFLYLLDKMIRKYRIKYQYKLWEKNRLEFWMPLYKEGRWRTSKEERYRLIDLAKKDWGLAWTQKGWERTRAYLDKLLQLQEEYKFQLVIVTFPAGVQLIADSSDAYMFLPQEKLKEYCQAHKITFIDILPYFKGHKDEEILFDHCHPTVLGLDLVAQAIYGAIKNKVPQ